MEEKMNIAKTQLEQVMAEYAKEDICLAFSGGVDSSLLLKTAANAAEKTGKKVYAVTFDSRLHPSCDLEIAARVAKELGGIHKVISVNELEQEEIRLNPVNRCYLCKKKLFQSLKSFAAEMNIRTIMDGTNEDDHHVYRPGIKALKELGIISPLAELHITKAQVKELAAWYGISVAFRPSAPCMATRLPYNTEIDYEVLGRIGQGEEYIKSLVKGNVRLRLHKDIVRIEVDREAMGTLLEKSREITSFLKELGFSYITMDLEGFRSGSMDAGIELVS
ncbi:ATP-dependent sacrificial sulfur transferase LarE [Clostridium sp. Marseille-P2415]|uniref:ATP-dependent sacrificial sulfur transferase LarE n=1 Tax=Clostridium sp. Marseille-P2415 TaxID=1805471 RepID=UPI0011157D1C|nr:ATP-dependent sacrificial sulfur transferase LarE [Clostridium sp. Marseille-P2415]